MSMPQPPAQRVLLFPSMTQPGRWSYAVTIGYATPGNSAREIALSGYLEMPLSDNTTEGLAEALEQIVSILRSM